MTDPKTDGEILETLARIARDLLEDDTLAITPETTGKDLPGWDSATYVNFVVAVEIELGIRFPLADVESFKTFGDIVQGVRRLKGRA